MLQSQLYGRARRICRKISQTDIQSASGSGAKKIVEAVFKRDALAVVSEVYQVFLSLMTTKRGNNESFRNFESRFEAKVSKFNFQSTEISFLILLYRSCFLLMQMLMEFNAYPF